MPLFKREKRKRIIEREKEKRERERKKEREREREKERKRSEMLVWLLRLLLPSAYLRDDLPQFHTHLQNIHWQKLTWRY